MLAQKRKDAPEEVGGCLDKETQEFRYSVVRTLLGCGIPLEKLDSGLGALLSRSGNSVPKSCGLRQYIPLVLEAEEMALLEDISGQWLCWVYDGMTRVGEAIALLVRYCTADFHVVYRLVGLKTAQKHMNGSQLSGTLIRLMTQRAGPPSLDFTLAAARDSCATNGVAMRSLQNSVLPNVLDVHCISHTLHNCAKHMEFEVLEEWLTPWFKLMAHSHAAKAIWKGIIDGTVKLFSKVRWWSRWECAEELAKNFHLLPQLLDELVKQSVGDATTATLVSIWEDAIKNAKLELELAVIMDASIFCIKTYRLEGNRLELLLVHEDIEAVREKGYALAASDKASAMPNTAAVLRKRTTLRVGTPIYEWFGPPYSKYFKGKVTKIPTAAAPNTYTVTYEDRNTIEVGTEELRSTVDIRDQDGWKSSRAHLTAAFTYLENRLTDNCDAPYQLSTLYDVYEAVRAFDPTFVNTGAVDTDFVSDRVAAIPWIDMATKRKLLAELPDYLVLCRSCTVGRGDATAFSEAVLTFWREVPDKISTWAFEARRAFCLTPNSAASERVFSRLKASFTDTQLASLSDYLEAALMLAVNQRVLG